MVVWLINRIIVWLFFSPNLGWMIGCLVGCLMFSWLGGLQILVGCLVGLGGQVVVFSLPILVGWLVHFSICALSCCSASPHMHPIAFWLF